MKIKPTQIYIGLIILLLISNLLVSVYSYRTKEVANHFTDQTKKYPLIDPARAIFAQENYSINVQDLRSYLSDIGKLYQTIGTKPVTLENLIKELSVNSDNTAQDIISKNLQVDDYTPFQGEVGLKELYNGQGLIFAKQLTRALRVLYPSGYTEEGNSEKILDYLAQSSFHNYLSQGIPVDVKFAHKYGENKAQSRFADSGIIYSDGKPYMLTAILKGKDPSMLLEYGQLI